MNAERKVIGSKKGAWTDKQVTDLEVRRCGF